MNNGAKQISNENMENVHLDIIPEYVNYQERLKTALTSDNFLLRENDQNRVNPEAIKKICHILQYAQPSQLDFFTEIPDPLNKEFSTPIFKILGDLSPSNLALLMREKIDPFKYVKNLSTLSEESFNNSKHWEFLFILLHADRFLANLDKIKTHNTRLPTFIVSIIEKHQAACMQASYFHKVIETRLPSKIISDLIAPSLVTNELQNHYEAKYPFVFLKYSAINASRKTYDAIHEEESQDVHQDKDKISLAYDKKSYQAVSICAINKYIDNQPLRDLDIYSKKEVRYASFSRVYTNLLALKKQKSIPDYLNLVQREAIVEKISNVKNCTKNEIETAILKVKFK